MRVREQQLSTTTNNNKDNKAVTVAGDSAASFGGLGSGVVPSSSGFRLR